MLPESSAFEAGLNLRPPAKAPLTACSRLHPKRKNLGRRRRRLQDPESALWAPAALVARIPRACGPSQFSRLKPKAPLSRLCRCIERREQQEGGLVRTMRAR